MPSLNSLHDLWFAARKLRLPIRKDWLVLEVGSGNSPCPRADVLLDLTLEAHERVGGRTIVDRPLVLGLVERLPFRTNAFDYVIAFHVLEHSSDPEKFLSEMQRVARAGYIETPAFWAERINPLTMHRLEVGLENGPGGEQLVIQKKIAPVQDALAVQQFHSKLIRENRFDRLAPEAWVTQYHWQDAIRYRVVNPEYKIAWSPPPDVTRHEAVDPRSLLRRFLKHAAGGIRRRRYADLKSLLQCVDCKHSPPEQLNNWFCPACGVSTSGLAGYRRCSQETSKLRLRTDRMTRRTQRNRTVSSFAIRSRAFRCLQIVLPYGQRRVEASVMHAQGTNGKPRCSTTPGRNSDAR